MSIRYSAPAKIILSGEHASVYGKPTLISALNLRLTISLIQKSKTKPDKIISHIANVVKKYLYTQKIPFDNKSYQSDITSHIPSGRNLGSSAALSVASTAAFLHFYTGSEFKRDIINLLAYEVEKKFHGNPSGGDNSTSCYGGLVYFRKEFEFLKSFSPLDFKIPQSFTKRLFIIDSGKPLETTKEMVVNIVGNKYKKETKKIEDIFNNIEKITKRMTVSIATSDINVFRAAIEESHKCLVEIGVVSKKTQILLAKLRPYGVGKVTGAGGVKDGSGNILFFADHTDDMKNYLQAKSISFFSFEQDYKGVVKI